MSPKGKAEVVQAEVASPVEEAQLDLQVDGLSSFSAPSRRRRRLLRGLRLGVLWSAGLFIALCLFVIWAIDQRFDVPGWIRSEAETRLEAQLNGFDIEFGEIQLVMNRGWRPRVSLRDVTLRHSDGSVALQVADAQATLAMRPLLRGQVRPKAISLSGLFAILTRTDGGAVALSFNEQDTAFRQAENFPRLMDQWDRQLQLPILSALTAVETNALTLRYEDARLGRAWTLDGGVIRLERDRELVDIEAAFSILSGRGYVSTVEASYQSDIGDAAAEFALVIDAAPSEDLATQSAALGWLELLRAPISGALRGAVDSEGALLPLSASLNIGEGVIQPEEAVKPVPFQGAQSYFTFHPDEQELRFDSFTVESGWGSGNMEGRATLVGVENGQLTELVGQLHFSDLNLNPARLYDAPLTLNGVTADFLIEMNPFRMRLGEMLVERDGLNLVLSGDVRAGETGWNYDLFGAAEALTPEVVKALWPTAAPPKPRTWVRENVLSGDIRDVQLALRGRDGSKPFLSLDFNFHNAEIKYHDHLPNLVGAVGQFSLYGNRLAVTATQGQVTAKQGGPVDVSGTSFIIPDTSLKDGNSFGVLRAMFRGNVTAALSLLNSEPLTVMDKAGLPVDLSTGTAALSGTLTTPLEKGVELEEMAFHYTGEIRDIESSALVPDLTIAASRLEIRGDQDFVEISGPGTVNTVPVTASWRQALGGKTPEAGRVSGQVELSSQAVQAFELGLPPEMVSGQGVAQFDIALPPKAELVAQAESLDLEGDEAAEQSNALTVPTLRLRSDLQGVGLRLPGVTWRKNSETEGDLSLDVSLGQIPEVTNLTLVAPGLSAQGQLSFNADGSLSRGVFPDVSLGGWLTGAVELSGRGAASPAVVITRGEIDLRRMPDAGASAGGATGDNTPITLNLNRLRVSDSISVSPFSGRFSTQGGFNGSYSGQLNGQAAVTGVVVPQNGGLALRVKSDNAGAVLSSMDILKNGVGGEFEMTLVPSQTSGEYGGQVLMKRLRVQRGPAIVALLNAISLVGLVDELSGQGILFSNVEADFRLGPDYVTLSALSAVGPSMGVTLEGLYNLKTDALDMRGVLSPLYLVNAVGSVFTRKGEGLLGFAFRVRGTGANPDVSVNPLSALAPGFLREVFRGEKPHKPGEEVKGPTAQERLEERRRRNEDR